MSVSTPGRSPSRPTHRTGPDLITDSPVSSVAIDAYEGVDSGKNLAVETHAVPSGPTYGAFGAYRAVKCGSRSGRKVIVTPLIPALRS